MIIRGEVTEDKLENVYRTVNQLIKNPSCYYTKEEIEELKTNKENVFIERKVK